MKFSRKSLSYASAITVGHFFHVQPEDATYNVMSTRHFFVFAAEFKVVLTYFKWFVTSISCSLNILPAAHLAACKATAVSRIQAHPSFLPHSTVAILGSTLFLIHPRVNLSSFPSLWRYIKEKALSDSTVWWTWRRHLERVLLDHSAISVKYFSRWSFSVIPARV